MEKFNKINSLPILLRNPKILVIGGGKTALQKIKVLIQNGIMFKLVAKDICKEIKSLINNYDLRKFESSDIIGYQYVVDATGNDKVGEHLSQLKDKYNFLLNRVDIPSECDFYFSSLLTMGKLKVAVSSDGASPTLSKLVRNKIGSFLSPELKNLCHDLSIERGKSIIDEPKIIRDADGLFGKVKLVGCGTGDPDLLTIKALKALQNADIVLHDYLVSQEILELIPERVKIIFAGKPHSHNQISQADINLMMLNYARAGNNVVRLKNGDPYIFGRGSEEAVYLIERNIRVEVVPGLSSVIAAPSTAGIPLTARGVASSFTVLTACKKSGEINKHVARFVGCENHTTIVLMGLHKITELIKLFNSANINSSLPAAIVCNGSRPNQRVITTDIKNLEKASTEAVSPAILIFGKVVEFNKILPVLNLEEYLSVNRVANSE